MYKHFFKRFIDITCSFLGLIVFSPILLISALIIKLSSKGPVFYRQRRIGKNEKEFRIFKFRSMKIDAPELSASDFNNPEQYVTKVGAFMRKTSIDELPQIINILIGQMSIIGPRPCIKSEKELWMLRKEGNVFSVRPGLTGLAQIHGRNVISDADKAAYDIEYISKITFLKDTKIFFKTVVKVFKSEGIVQGDVSQLLQHPSEEKTLFVSAEEVSAEQVEIPQEIEVK